MNPPIQKKIRNLPDVMKALKLKLREYLVLQGTKFTPNEQRFQCPNRKSHANNDDDPSATFWKDDDAGFHCYSCGANGNIYDAAFMLEDLPLPKTTYDWIYRTVVPLAERLDVAVECEDFSPEEQERYEAYNSLSRVTDRLHTNFWKSVALDYARKRNWSDETITAFELGYCESYENLRQWLYQEGISHAIQIKGGLAPLKQVEPGKFIGAAPLLFTKRIVFPIRDENGRVHGFAGRTLLDKSAASESGIEKYVNSDTTTIYSKSTALFNVHNVRDEEVMIVEGYADVVTLYQKGVKNCVGLGGTAFTEEHIQLLIRRGVKRLILCLDNDKAGLQAEDRILSKLTRQHGLTVFVKERDDCEDPDTCLQKHDYLLTSPIKALPKHFIDRFKVKGNQSDRDRALLYITWEPSALNREKLFKEIAKDLDTTKDVIKEEVDGLVSRQGDQPMVDLVEIDRMSEELRSSIWTFRKNSLTRGELLGLKTSHPILTKALDGIQPMYYIIAGDTQTGKSTFARTLASGILDQNPDQALVLYFTIDDTKEKFISRWLASSSGLTINQVENPNYHIQQNDRLTDSEKAAMMQRLDAAYRNFDVVSESGLLVYDETKIRSITDMERLIRMAKHRSGGRKLVVFIDSLHRMRLPAKYKKESTREHAMTISDTLKEWCNLFAIPIIATAELRRPPSSSSGRRPTLHDIKEASDFEFDAEVCILMYNEWHSFGRLAMTATMKFADPPESENFFPVVEAFFAKNKGSSFEQRCLYYKFYPSRAIMAECTPVEQDNWEKEVLRKLTDSQPREWGS